VYLVVVLIMQYGSVVCLVCSCLCTMLFSVFVWHILGWFDDFAWQQDMVCMVFKHGNIHSVPIWKHSKRKAGSAVVLVLIESTGRGSSKAAVR
jgi:hypothetical protein